MNKFNLSLALCLGLAFSPLCAVESKKITQQDFTSADASFLFSTSANALNVETLSEEEMQKTEGEGFLSRLLKSLAKPHVLVCTFCIVKK